MRELPDSSARFAEPSRMRPVSSVAPVSMTATAVCTISSCARVGKAASAVMPDRGTRISDIDRHARKSILARASDLVAIDYGKWSRT